MLAVQRALEPIQPHEIMNVLFIEHDVSYRQRISRDLESLGCRVDPVAMPVEAIEKLSTGKYQVVIVDIKFPQPAVSGDQFIISNHSLMRGAQLVALTGNRQNIRFNSEFDSLGVIIIDKGEEDVPLQNLSREVYERTKDDLLERVNEAKEDSLKGELRESYPLAKEYLSSLQEELLRELEQIEDKKTKTLQYKGKFFSISELINQVREGTDIGAHLTRMMSNLIRWRETHAQAPHGVDPRIPSRK